MISFDQDRANISLFEINKKNFNLIVTDFVKIIVGNCILAGILNGACFYFFIQGVQTRIIVYLLFWLTNKDNISSNEVELSQLR